MGMAWVQQRDGVNWKCIHACVFIAQTLYLQVGAFNALTDVYDPVIIFLSVLGLLSVGLFLLLFPAQTSSFNICCKADLVLLNSLNFCFSGKRMISPSNLKKSLAGQSILDCRIFPFITLNMSCHSLLACRVSVEKSADSLMGVLLYVICHFSLVAFKYFISVF